MVDQYEDFKLTVVGKQGKYTVRAEGPNGINIDPIPFTLEKTPALVSKIEHLKWKLPYPKSSPAELMCEVGTLLFDALFPRKIIRAFERSYQAEANLRLKLRIVPLELNDLPWELLFDSDDGRYLAARRSMPVVRMVESSSGVSRWEGKRAPRILYVQANPDKTRELETSQSEQVLREAFSGVESIHQAQPENLQTSLLKKYDILHYDGHAKFDQKQDTGHLYLHDAEGKKHEFDGQLLSSYLDGAGLRLVVLAACETAVEDKEKSFSGIAQKLMHTVDGLPAVVAMQFAIPDASAIAFARGFYRALAAGYQVDAATVEGRKAILGILRKNPFDSPDWFTPVVYMHSEDGDILREISEEELEDQERKTGGGKIVQGDEVSGDKVMGDKVLGDQIRAEQYIAQQIVVKQDAVASIEELEPAEGAPPYNRPPYMGMSYFNVDDANLFFGREQLTAQIVNRFHQTRFLAIVGASGSGKSSLLRAGVVAALMEGGVLADGSLPPSRNWSIRIMKPSSTPLEALVVALTGRGDPQAVLDLQDQLVEDRRVLPILARQLMQADGSDHLLLAVDQFEELFTLCKEESERRAFLDILLAAVSPETRLSITVILTLRADFYAECSAYEDLRQLLARDQAYIGPMNRAEMYSAVTRPLLPPAPWKIQTGLPELILDELGTEPGALALLSHALLETWRNRRGYVMTLSGYEEAGRVRGAIAKTAENVYCHRLSEEERPIARNIFIRLTELGEGTQDTRRRATYGELVTSSQKPELLDKVLKKLSDARLVVTDQLAGKDEEIVDVAHEALIRHWSRLREWLKEDRGLLRMRLIVHRAAVEWKDKDKRESYLVHREERLKQVAVLLNHPRLTLTDDERSYLEACQKLDSLTKASIAAMGWGVIFAHNADPAVRYALRELLDHRKKQATSNGENPNFYREFTGRNAYQPDDTKSRFLARHGVGASLPSPDKMPYYLLIVGDPESISFSFQYQLDMQYAVGRIHFDTLDEYAQYARSVVTAETTELTLSQRAVIFAPQNEDDRATAMVVERLVKPLSETLKEKRERWQIDRVLKDEATKERLGRLIGGDQTSPLLFTCGHGLALPMDDERQLLDQGALITQDWPGPDNWQGRLKRDFYFNGQDVSPEAQLLGSVFYMWGCYGAATPKMDNYHQQSFRDEPQQLAAHPFVSHLPQRLLGHPKGGVLAVIGSVERKWSYSFSLERGVEDLDHFLTTLLEIMDGYPIGAAMEYFNQRYASLMTELVTLLERSQAGEVDPYQMAGMWTATNDARNYIILGDPAVQLRVSETGVSERPVIEPGISLDKNEEALQATIDEAAEFWSAGGRCQQGLQHQGEALEFVELYGSLFWRKEPGRTYLDACRLNEAIGQAAATWEMNGRLVADLIHLGDELVHFENTGLRLEEEPAATYIAACKEIEAAR